MKNLIYKILKEEKGFETSSDEDWDWVHDVPDINYGKAFNENMVGFDYEGSSVNVMPDRVEYLLDVQEFMDIIDNDDWMLRDLLSGGYNHSDYPPELDPENEVNYSLIYHLDEDHIDRLNDIINHPNFKKKVFSMIGKTPRQLDLFKHRIPYGNDISWNQKKEIRQNIELLDKYKSGRLDIREIMNNEQISDFSRFFNAIYRGRHGWDDFVGVFLNEMEHAMEANRVDFINADWNHTLDRFSEILELENGRYDELKVTVFNPDYNNKDLTNILIDAFKEAEIDNYWSDYYYEHYDTSGMDNRYINDSFNNFLDKLEEAIEEM
jgi:hypothetical protein